LRVVANTVPTWSGVGREGRVGRAKWVGKMGHGHFLGTGSRAQEEDAHTKSLRLVHSYGRSLRVARVHSDGHAK
jgi:hypothetical protein